MITVRQYADAHNLTTLEVFVEAWTRFVGHAPSAEQNRRIMQDVESWNIHGTTQHYVEALMQGATPMPQVATFP